jgi:hypothetical protein
VQAAQVVPAFQILEESVPGLFVGIEVFAMEQFRLERAKEGFTSRA